MVNKVRQPDKIIKTDNETEMALIKPLYDSISEYIKEKNEAPVFRLLFSDGTQIIAEYYFSMNDMNVVSALYHEENEIPEYLKKQGFEQYYEFIFHVLKVEIKKEKVWIEENKNIGFSYHDFPVKLELI